MKHLKILGYVIAAEFLSLFIGITLATSSSAAIRLISAICTTGILVCFMVSYAITSAKADLRNERTAGTKINSLSVITTGITASLPALFSWIVLYVSHSSGRFDFYRWHKILNAYFLQIYNFINADASTAALSSGEVLGMLVLVAIPFVSYTVAYFLAKNMCSKSFAK